MIIYDEKIKKKLLDYYMVYYRNLGIPGFERNAYARLNEDEWELRRIKKMERSLSWKIKNYQCHLIIGLGTGGLAVALQEIGISDIYGIEPYKPALELARLKGTLMGLPDSSFIEAVAENLPYSNNYFDFIHCFSVLEHVQNVRKAIKEMYRVTKSDGVIYIHTPNYLWPYEGHYKVPAPTFLPFAKVLTTLWLKILGRPTEYLSSINFYSTRKLNKILKNELSIFCRVYSVENRKRQFPTGDTIKSSKVRTLRLRSFPAT